MSKIISGKVTHVGQNKAGETDSILMNVGHAKTLTVKYNDKHFGGELIEKGSVVRFQCDSIHEVTFEDKDTGVLKDGNYLETANFKMLSQKAPNFTTHRKEIDLGGGGEQASEAPAQDDSDDPANFQM